MKADISVRLISIENMISISYGLHP